MRALLAASVLCALSAQDPLLAQQLPSGLNVVRGIAQVQTQAGRMTVTNSANAILQWQRFSIGAGNAVRFQQPGPGSAVLNRVTGNDPSQLFGQLSSNGRVWLLNPNGVIFGPSSRVDVAGLVASTLNLSDSAWLAGRPSLVAQPGSGAVVNLGEIRTPLGGTIVLVGASEGVRNEGLLQAPGGHIVLAAGQSVDLADTATPNVAVRVASPSGEVLNLGRVIAGAGGRIDLQAAMVNQQGVVRAEGLQAGPGGSVRLAGSNSVVLASGSETRSDGVNGGSVRVEGGTVAAAGQVSAAGAAGRGGQVDVLGRYVAVMDGATLDASGATGGGAVHVGGGARGGGGLPEATATYVAPEATLRADASRRGDGGEVVAWSRDATRAYGHFSARGGPEGGNGGFIETSGHWLDARPASLSTGAPIGHGGEWLLDPTNLRITSSDRSQGVISSSNTDVTPSSSFFVSIRSPSVLNTADIENALMSTTSVTIATGDAGSQEGNISTDAGAAITVSPPRAVSLTLTAHRDIQLNNFRIESTGAPLNVTLEAAANGTVGSVQVVGSTIITRGGDLTMGGLVKQPTGTSGATANAAMGDLDPDVGERVQGIRITGRSTLDAGSGSITLHGASKAPDAFFDPERGIFFPPRGVGISQSILRGSDVTIRGWASTAPVALDVQLRDVQIDATGEVVLEGLGDGRMNVFSTPITAPGKLEMRGRDLLVVDSPLSAQSVVLQAEGQSASVGLRSSQVDAGGVELIASGQDAHVFLERSPVDARSTVLLRAGPQGTLSIDDTVHAIGTLDLRADHVELLTPSSSCEGCSAISALLPSSGVARLSSDAAGDAIVIAGSDGSANTAVFLNQAGADALKTPNGRWLLYAASPLDPNTFALGDLVYGFKAYDRRFGDATFTNGVRDTPLPVSGLLFENQPQVTLRGQASKVYDGGRAGSIAGSALSIVGGTLQADRYVAPAQVRGDFDDAHVLTASVFTPRADDLTFFEGTVPVFGYQVTTIDGRITPAPLRASVAVAAKTYDGSPAASATGSLIGLAGNEQLDLRLGAAFENWHAGTARPVRVDVAIADGPNGARASDYQLLTPVVPATADIGRRILTPAFGVADKVYDGRPDATPVPSSGSGLSGLVPGESLTLQADGRFDTSNAATGRRAVITLALADGANGRADDYRLSTDRLDASATIERRPLSVDGVSAAGKVYDATPQATITGWQLGNVVAGDQVFVTSGHSEFASAHAGVAVTVNATAQTLGGEDVANYVLAQPTTSTTATIEPATLTYRATPVTGRRGDPLPALHGTVNGFLGSDTPASATQGSAQFSTTATPLAPEGRYAVLGGGLSANDYVFVQDPANATALTLLPLSIDEGSKTVAQTIDRTTPAVSPPMAAPRTLDVTQAMTPRGDAFRELPLASMEPAALAITIAARDQYKAVLFSKAVDKLSKDSTLADLPACVTMRQVEEGDCLITEELRGQIQLARATEGGATAVALGAGTEAARPSASPATPATTEQPSVVSASGTSAAQAAAAPVPPAKLLNPRAVRNAALPQIQRKVALLIGVDNFEDTRIPALVNAVKDARAVGEVLERQLGYETIVLDNPTRQHIVSTINRLASELGPQDSVVLYYAGHGTVVPSTGLGYWQPANARADDPRTWLSNSDIARLVSQFGASQVALISDSCYSGAFVSPERPREGGQVDPGQVLTRRTAVSMSSGGNEPVFDEGKQGHSPFAWSLMQHLQRVNDWQVGGNVFERVRFAVAREMPQRPRYGTFAGAGHQAGGEYLFEQRRLEDLK